MKFPIAVDNDRSNWKVWYNRYWPTVYVDDWRGRVRYGWEGELSYQGASGEETVRKLVEALSAASIRKPPRDAPFDGGIISAFIPHLVGGASEGSSPDNEAAKGMAEGVPNPGIFTVDRKGVIRAKLFLERNRLRHTTESPNMASRVVERPLAPE